jgi:hypothetical protein
MSGFQLQRLGQIMEPQSDNAQEIEGVLNPPAARGPDGHLHLFPRLVADGNFSSATAAIFECRRLTRRKHAINRVVI